MASLIQAYCTYFISLINGMRILTVGRSLGIAPISFFESDVSSLCNNGKYAYVCTQICAHIKYKYLS